MSESSSAYRVPESVLWHAGDGQAVLLNLDSGRYFGLDEVGIRVWEALTTAVSLDEAIRRLEAQYDVAPDVLRADVAVLAGELVAQGLLEAVDGRA